MTVTPRLSVVICTHNRAHIIGHAINSLLNQTVSEADFDIIVIDNASNDDTQGVVEEFARLHSHVRIVFEPNTGLSHARNRGAKEATGSIIAYIDDDAIADPGWVAALLSVYDEEPEAVCVGGPVSLGFREPPPSWLPARALDAYGRLDRGTKRKVVGDGLFGCNMSFQREVLLEMGGFDSRLGREGLGLIGGEESDMMIRLERCGRGSIVYEPNAHVVHMVDPARVSLRWLLRRGWGDGRTTRMWRPSYPLVPPVVSYGKAATNFLIALGLGGVGLVSQRAMQTAVTRAMRGAFHVGVASVEHGTEPIDSPDRGREGIEV